MCNSAIVQSCNSLMARQYVWWRVLVTIVLLHYCAIALTGCSVGEDIFEDLGTNISGPTGFFVDSVNRRLYVTNSNSGVSYDWQQGSLQILSIADPQIPTPQGTVQTQSFSGEVYVDVVNSRAYVANRFSEGEGTTSDRLLRIDVSNPAEPSVEQEVSAKLNPFAVDCCAGDTNDILLSTSSQGILQYGTIGGTSLTLGDVNLLQPLSDGGSIRRATITDVEMIGNQAFLSRAEGGILVVNLSEITDTSKNPADYFIDDIRAPRGMAVYGTKLLVADEDTVNGTFTSRVLVLNILDSSDATTPLLVPSAENTDTTVISKDDTLFGVSSITVGRNPQRIEVSGDQAFVTNMDDDTISILNLTDNTAGTPIAVGDQPFGIGIDVDGTGTTTVYIGNLNDNTISILQGSGVVGTYP